MAFWMYNVAVDAKAALLNECIKLSKAAQPAVRVFLAKLQ